MSDDIAVEHGPDDPIVAVTHPDPYGYYARLARERPFHRDPALGVWVASSAAAVTAVLTSPACRVRPTAEPVPTPLAGSPAGEIFRHLVRMSDGDAHRTHRRAVATMLEAFDGTRPVRESERWARRLADGIGPASASARLAQFAFAIPVSVVGSLLGCADEELPMIVELVGRFVRCIAPGGTPEQHSSGMRAAGELRERMLGSLTRRGIPDTSDAVVANAIGLMTQSYDATAGLIGTTLLTLARQPAVHARVAESPALLDAVIDEVLRYDSPVQNTRRFVAEPVRIEGVTLSPGDAVLVLLAAANRDPAANADPDRFHLTRHDRRLFTFGVGAHACPGRAIATTIARAAVARLLENGVAPEGLDPRPAYRPSMNARIPMLAWRRA
jgi:cytochrome P450